MRLRINAPKPARAMTWDNVVLDFDARSVTVDGKGISLTNHEFNILAFLDERPGRPITRRLLAEQTLTSDADISERTVDSHVARIRRKLGEVAGARIMTVWGTSSQYRLYTINSIEHRWGAHVDLFDGDFLRIQLDE